MGYYLETPEPIMKAAQLVEVAKATRQDKPYFNDPHMTDFFTVCVVSNGPFDAAGICFDKAEFNAFLHPDGRQRVWLTVPKTYVLSEHPWLAEYAN